MSGKLTAEEIQMSGLSTVRRNLLTREGYAPYCGNLHCHLFMPRTHFIDGQFRCGCGWSSDFEPEFIAAFLSRWPRRAALKETAND